MSTTIDTEGRLGAAMCLCGHTRDKHTPGATQCAEVTALTPGPWRVEPWKYSNPDREVLTIQTDTDAIAQVLDLWPPDGREKEKQANARALAEVPNLVEALRTLVACLNMSDEDHEDFTDSCADVVQELWQGMDADSARALLARIEGREP